ncbi:hypothetical protein ABIB57_004423 [Devosia sp. UYZn731]|uniref:alginate O-acetyltransferase AlgF n=1 Tax=Devosia sp. UYZn731 TaxID=3156345 RepID=UPI0033930BDC
MNKPSFFLCMLGFVSASMVGHSAAQDAALYDNAIDPGKAYVRVVLQDGDQASIGGAPVTLADKVSGYVSIAPGSVELGADETKSPATVDAGTYYTFVQSPAGFTQFIDPPIGDPSKAEILFYNLTDQPSIDLFVPAAKTNAIVGVAAGGSKSVELRAPLTLGFEAQSSGTSIASVDSVDLERKQAISLFLTQSADGVQLRKVLNSFADAK